MIPWKTLRKPREALEIVPRELLWSCSSVAAIGEDAVGEGQSVPVLDRDALRVLDGETGERASRRFVEEYLRMLPARGRQNP